ncbi:MAG: hypothetical protein AAGG75_16650 [Bacteroidota bacterium]
MKKLAIPFLLFCTISILFTACATDNRTETEKAIDNAAEDLKEGMKDLEKGMEDMKTGLKDASAEAGDELSKAMNNLQEALGTTKDGEKVETVSFRELKKYMPNRLAGLKLNRDDMSGETNGIGGIKVSTAEGTYEKGDKRITVSITDTGGIGAAFLATAVWSNLEIDRESKDEVEYTDTQDGHKVYVKYNKKRQSGEYNFFVNKRFVVKLEGKNVSLDDLEEAGEDLDLDDLGE